MKELVLEELSIEQKIGQLLTVRGFLDDNDRSFVYEMLEKKAVGAVQVRYTPNCHQLISEIKSHADYPVLIVSDMECGFPGSKLHIPCQMGISATGDENVAYEFGRVTAIEAKKCGYNMVWSPVVDIAKEGALCKNNRCFSDDVETVSKYACAMIRGFLDEGMMCTAKHFPGGSDLTDDGHITEKISHMTEEELIKKDLIPYIAAMKEANLPGIMSGHNIFANIDGSNNTTFSSKIIGIIRKLGFDGLMVTDSLAMMSIARKYGAGECIPKAIAAGNDNVLPNYRLSFRESYNYMMEGYKKGIITEERINEAVRRMIAAQHITLRHASSCEVSEQQKEIISNISKKALCALTKKGESVSLDMNTKKLFVLLCENTYPETDGESLELMIPDWFSRKNMEAKKQTLLNTFQNSKVIIMNEFPNQLEIEDVCVAMADADETIFFTFCRQSSYLASDSLTKRVEYVIKSNIDEISTVVHIGSPYELKKFKGAKRILFGVPGGECAEYAIKALTGEFIPSGNLPVKGGVENELREYKQCRGDH